MKNYFIHLTSDPKINPSAAMMSIFTASEALKQGHNVTYFAAGDGVRILLKDVIENLHCYSSRWRYWENKPDGKRLVIRIF